MLLSFKWTVSKARDTYGYNIVTLKVNGKKVAQCDGGGYDMTGTCLGNWMEKHFKKELLKFKYNKDGRSDFYGLRLYKGRPYIDGACGFSSVERILKKLGYRLNCFDYKTNHQDYELLKIE